MGGNRNDLIFRYWGKATQAFPLPRHLYPGWHLLPYHCLDVAAVGAAWWEVSRGIRRAFAHPVLENQSRAWVLFFLALHDLGKFDRRFQAKAPSILAELQPGVCLPPPNNIQIYPHGPAGLAWFEAEWPQWVGAELDWMEIKNWRDWLAAVAGHHGQVPPGGDDSVTAGRMANNPEDKQARAQWLTALEALFLQPEGLSLRHSPPAVSPLLAGFCSVCDWLGSDADHFTYCAERQDLAAYFQSRLGIARQVLTVAQLHQPSLTEARFATLYPDKSPRQAQTLVDDLPLPPALTLIEAPTGSGKTEAALTLCARIIAAGLAESIVFALPTQATANAMLGRLDAIAGTLFPDGSNIVLAHGKAAHHPYFDQLKTRAAQHQAQGKENASVHCAQWIAASRKRALLGQIGVCTVDQVLLSVLPVKHNFVRTFGLGKSVLVVDEVHAYDSYMLGLLGEVLARQCQAGGSAILLSATLPSNLRWLLLNAWQGEFHAGHAEAASAAPYPLVTQCTATGKTSIHEVAPEHRPPQRTVNTRLYPAPDMLPDAGLCDDILAAARAGAKVAVICNLVADAQHLADQLRQQAEDIPVDLFHSRYRFVDRQEKEQTTLREYGEKRPDGGRVLVATQVVEQSLDLDFDWIVTQLCPMDLLFQRLGRLHRHAREKRPPGFVAPSCTVLIPEGASYGPKQIAIYCEAVLWRTQQCLPQQAQLSFPDVYRPLIEQVYQQDPWADEPEIITKKLGEHLGKATAKRSEAIRLARETINPFDDDAQTINVFTRDGEFGPNVLLMTLDGNRLLFRPELDLAGLQEWDQAEILDQEAIPVPNSWRGNLPQVDLDNRVRLTMREIAPGRYEAQTPQSRFVYDQNIGLRMEGLTQESLPTDHLVSPTPEKMTIPTTRRRP